MSSADFVMECPAIESRHLPHIYHDARRSLDSLCHCQGGNTDSHQEVQAPGLDTLEQRREERCQLAIACNLQPPGGHGSVQGQPSIDEQDIVPCVTAEGHVGATRSEEHTSELQSLRHLVC